MKESIKKMISEVENLLTKESIHLKDKKLLAKRKSLSFLDSYCYKVGIYLFCNSDSIPIYIGAGGIGKCQDLKTRISQELRWYDNVNKKGDSGAILSINMNLEKNKFFEELESMKLFVYIIGNVCEENKQNIAKNLERELITKFDSELLLNKAK
ncbi:MAG: hypothetical protein WCW84_05295 [Sulfurimonas sp.]|jgi:hypothetical protein